MTKFSCILEFGTLYSKDTKDDSTLATFFPWKAKDSGSTTDARCVEYAHQKIHAGGSNGYGKVSERLSNYGNTVASWSECQSMCESDINCRHVTYSQDSKSCYRTSKSPIHRDVVRLRVYTNNNDNKLQKKTFSILSGSTMDASNKDSAYNVILIYNINI